MPKEFKKAANTSSPSGMETVQNLTKITGSVGTTAKPMAVAAESGDGMRQKERLRRIKGAGEIDMQSGSQGIPGRDTGTNKANTNESQEVI